MKLGNFKAVWKYDRLFGHTRCELSRLESPDIKYHGSAVLGENDSFCKDVGRKVSLARALETITAIERRKVWEDYRMSKPGGRW